MRVLVCGSRGMKVSRHTLLAAVESVCGVENLTEIIHGDCPTGADSTCAEYAEAYNVMRREFKADWDAHGKSAGPIRNQRMIEERPNFVIAFWDGKSKGTLDTISRAAGAGIPVYIEGR